ncbi:hypothetical protein [Pantoea phage LIMEzero]|uniref:Uncharacterized protein n=1 Tax=Pantoea phage LIMEzero TaxID=943335 RepID=F4N9S3_9CAUD|nr:hypothetical protein LIMEzero_ORF20 [Pantoea phage LIMEzero]CBY88551.1 hypothetical protein [Pantoea phage LIMEzero]
MAEEKQYRISPLRPKEQGQIKALYKAGDSFRNASALSERYNVPPADIIAVVNDTYRKGKPHAKD